MRCGGRGICGCGRPECDEAAWWFAWGGLWHLIAFELDEMQRGIDYASMDERG